MQSLPFSRDNKVLDNKAKYYYKVKVNDSNRYYFSYQALT